MRSLVSTDERRMWAEDTRQHRTCFHGPAARGSAHAHKDPRRKPGEKLSTRREGELKQAQTRGSGERGGEGASRRATLNGVARDSPGLVVWSRASGCLRRQSRRASRVEGGQRGGSAKERQPGRFRPLPSVSSSTAAGDGGGEAAGRGAAQRHHLREARQEGGEVHRRRRPLPLHLARAVRALGARAARRRVEHCAVAGGAHGAARHDGARRGDRARRDEQEEQPRRREAPRRRRLGQRQEGRAQGAEEGLRLCH